MIVVTAIQRRRFEDHVDSILDTWFPKMMASTAPEEWGLELKDLLETWYHRDDVRFTRESMHRLQDWLAELQDEAITEREWAAWFDYRAAVAAGELDGSLSIEPAIVPQRLVVDLDEALIVNPLTGEPLPDEEVAAVYAAHGIAPPPTDDRTVVPLSYEPQQKSTSSDGISESNEPPPQTANSGSSPSEEPAASSDTRQLKPDFLLRWLYTGDTYAPDDVYEAAREAAGEAYSIEAPKAHERLEKLSELDPTGLAQGTNAALRALEGDIEKAKEAIKDIAAGKLLDRIAKKAPGPSTRKIGAADDAAKLPKSTKNTQKRVDAKKQVQQHHSDPDFLGGEKKQPRTPMSVEQHRQLHKDLNDFLRTKVDPEGHHMRPQRGNPGRMIRERFTRQKLLEAMAEFYTMNKGKYPTAARAFFDQHPQFRKGHQ